MHTPNRVHHISFTTTTFPTTPLPTSQRSSVSHPPGTPIARQYNARQSPRTVGFGVRVTGHAGVHEPAGGAVPAVLGLAPPWNAHRTGTLSDGAPYSPLGTGRASPPSLLRSNPRAVEPPPSRLRSEARENPSPVPRRARSGNASSHMSERAPSPSRCGDCWVDAMPLDARRENARERADARREVAGRTTRTGKCDDARDSPFSLRGEQLRLLPPKESRERSKSGPPCAGVSHPASRALHTSMPCR
ncbi:hypothetical protein T484DRAFT_1951566, partial [Baffinella frigidus]